MHQTGFFDFLRTVVIYQNVSSLFIFWIMVMSLNNRPEGGLMPFLTHPPNTS
jgi:hypothetical protein